MRPLSLLLAAAAVWMLHDPARAANDEHGNPQDDGMRQGLAAHYFRDPVEWDGHWAAGTKPTVEAKDWTFREYKYSRLEPLVNHLFIRRGWFSVRWIGYLKVPEPKDGGAEVDLNIELWMDDGARLFVDGQSLIDDWVPCPEDIPEAHRIAKMTLTPGFHRIVIEYFQGESLENQDHDPAKCFWSSKALGLKRTIVPASRFFHTAADLQDYVPSQGLSNGDLAELNGGTEPFMNFEGPPVGEGPGNAPPANNNNNAGGNGNKDGPQDGGPKTKAQLARKERELFGPKQKKGEAPPNAKRDAQQMLLMAKNWLANGEDEKAGKLLNQVIADYPGTKAAQQAADLLAGK